MPGVSYRFGRFVLDYDTRQLLCDGDEIHLSPKAFELLVDPARRIGRAPCRRPSCRSDCGRRRSSRRRTWRVSSPRFAARFAIPRRGPFFCARSIGSAIALSVRSWRLTRRRAPAPARPEAVPRLREPADVLLRRRQRHRPRAGRDDPVRCPRRVAASRAHCRVEGRGDAGGSRQQERHVSARRAHHVRAPVGRR